jgi:hypothetical protein
MMIYIENITVNNSNSAVAPRIVGSARIIRACATCQKAAQSTHHFLFDIDLVVTLRLQKRLQSNEVIISRFVGEVGAKAL